MPAAQSVHDRAIAALYSDHHGWLLGWLRRRLGNGWDAADLAQDTFVRLLVAPEGTPEKQRAWQLDEPRAYLTLIAKRLLANLHRRRALEQAYLETLAQLPAPLAPAPEQRALLLEALQQIDAALNGLPAPVRTAFLLAQLEGLGQAAIAARLSVSERTVKRYMVQAMARCIVHLP
jgi:RNA polymerase sigma-70 factor (ECF subfamily)